MTRALLALGLLGSLGCRRENILFSATPYLEYVSIAPRRVPEYSTVQVVVRYRDGDGDLGGQADGSPDLFLIDLRDSSRFPEGYDGILRYTMPRFHEGPPQSIQGTIEISIPSVVRLDPTNPAEPFQVEVYLKDRAGNFSNRVRTEVIYIVP
ncbi:MAG: hypothetical protein ABDH91_04830 [Bacteroidia bacterium]